MEKIQAIWWVVGKIPKGKVCTYGKVAELAGLPGHARYVGFALKQLTADSTIPWHRVVNSRGLISFPVDSEHYQTQKKRLQDETIYFEGQHINLRHYLWQP
jgi:methylated-DNA-protein-cysteine methyltransferase related protein